MNAKILKHAAPTDRFHIMATRRSDGKRVDITGPLAPCGISEFMEFKFKKDFKYFRVAKFKSPPETAAGGEGQND